MTKKSKASFSRRGFIGTTATAVAGFSVIPSQAVAGLGHTPPSDKLNIAGIGIGGKGKVNLRNMPGQNIVALCDVDWNYASPVFETYPNAKKWKDYRKMLNEQKDIDAVVIATPDHTHAVSAAAAMELGKNVYLQKPLTHSVWESRYLTDLAKKTGVVTQMGNEGHSSDSVYEVTEVLHSGCLGEVKDVHVCQLPPKKYKFRIHWIGICLSVRLKCGLTTRNTIRGFGEAGGILEPAHLATWGAIF